MTFDLLTKAQCAVMDVLCTMQQRTMQAVDIKPSTLGCLCAMGLVDVVDGAAKATRILEWNLEHHPEMYGDISEACMKEVQEEVDSGRRIGAIKSLRGHAGLDLKNAIVWMDHHYPKL